MNRYPWWKYLIMVLALIFGLIYTLPNFFGEAPAVQISSAKSTVKVDLEVKKRVEDALKTAGLTPDFVQYEVSSTGSGSVRARFDSTDNQIKAKDVLIKALNPQLDDSSYIVALNLVPRSPMWLQSLHALPMYLGLDLRGGVHFLMQVDVASLVDKRIDSAQSAVRTLFRDKEIRHEGINRVASTLEVRFGDGAMADSAIRLLNENQPDWSWVKVADNAQFVVRGQFKPEAAQRAQSEALKQNITTLHNRINELGVAEPVIQQQGADRIVVQLPGVQDTAKAKDILGRTATLEVRLVDDSAEAMAALSGAGPVPFGSDRYEGREIGGLIVKKQVILTGENLTDAQAGFDDNKNPAVHLTLDSNGARIFRDVTRANINKRMAILLFEKGKGEVVTAPVIRDEIGGGRVQISGAMTTQEAADTALLLRAGSLAAPMDIIEERTIGPSLGAENISKGFHSVLWGFVAIAIFMCLYYMLFGGISTVALALNLFLLVAVLSLLQATLTLPGIAAIALVLGMAIDANVLINERIREELRNGSSPQAAIHAGYERAWATILDSNVTTLIAGLALLAFGSGPVRGFAVVHCLGILTSMFSAVFFSRGLVNLWYGRQKRLKSLSIGQVWRPEGHVVADEVAEVSGQDQAKLPSA